MRRTPSFEASVSQVDLEGVEPRDDREVLNEGTHQTPLRVCSLELAKQARSFLTEQVLLRVLKVVERHAQKEDSRKMLDRDLLRPGGVLLVHRLHPLPPRRLDPERLPHPLLQGHLDPDGLLPR